MKLNKILAAAAVALATAVSANAATYTQGDLILGIYDSTNTAIPALEFNLGAYSDYANGGGHGFVLNIGDEMIATFGADWATNSNLKWGLAAFITGAGTSSQLAFGIYESTFGTVNTSTLTKLSSPSSARAAVSAYGSSGYQTATTVEGDGYLIARSSSYEISDYDTASSDFGTSKQIIVPLADYNNAENTKALDLFYYAGTANGVYQDTTFTIDSTGEILAVPEPSSYVLMAVGGLGLLRMFRRRSIKNA